MRGIAASSSSSGGRGGFHACAGLPHSTAMQVMTILMVYIVLVAFLIWVCVVSDPNSDSLGT